MQKSLTLFVRRSAAADIQTGFHHVVQSAHLLGQFPRLAPALTSYGRPAPGRRRRRGRQVVREGYVAGHLPRWARLHHAPAVACSVLGRGPDNGPGHGGTPSTSALHKIHTDAE